MFESDESKMNYCYTAWTEAGGKLASEDDAYTYLNWAWGCAIACNSEEEMIESAKSYIKENNL